MKRILALLFSAMCLCVCSCENPIDGHNVTDFRILNYSNKSVECFLNGNALEIPPMKTDMYISAPMDSPIKIETTETHLTCVVRYAVFHNEQFYNYIEIRDMPSYNCIASNTSSFEIKITFGNAQDDWRIIPPNIDNFKFTSYVKKEDIISTLASNGICADKYVCVEYAGR